MRRPSPRCTPNSIAFQLVSWARDAAGGRKAGYAPQGPTIPASVQPTGTADVGEAGKEQWVTTYDVIVHDDPTAILRERIIWLDGGGLVLTVRGVRPAAGRMRSWAIACDNRR